jgi:very-short-patch-repair endonuclease
MNGYWVLRFLAEDVGKALDRVLDTIMNAIGRTRRQMDSDLP